MEASPDGPRELERHLEHQMRAQERQLAWARLGMVALAAVVLLALAPGLDGLGILLAILAILGLLSLAAPLLLRRFPAREVGIVSTGLEMAAVTVAVYVAAGALDAYLFYGLVILGVALRFGLAASVWASLVMSGLYLAVTLLASGPDTAVRELLPARVLYLIAFGVAAGLFSRIMLGRATEVARLQARLSDEARERERQREQQLVVQLGRDFGATLDRDATRRAVTGAAAQLLGDAVLLLTETDGDGRLDASASDGTDAELADRWRRFVAARRPKVGEGALGGVAATVTERTATDEEIETGDPDGIRELGLGWIHAVPIISGGRLLGVLAAAGHRGRALDDTTRRLASAVADRAGPAMQNA